MGVLKKSEPELSKRNSTKLYKTLEHVPTSILITDRNGNIEYVNPAFCKVTGYSSGEVIGKTPRIVKSGKIPPKVYKELWSTILAGNEWKGQLINKKKNGELYEELTTIAPVKNKAGKITHFIATIEDITVIKEHILHP